MNLKNQSELYRAQIKNRLRRRGEPLIDPDHEIKKLIRYAYPDASLEVREQLGRDCFIDSINDHEMEWLSTKGKPKFVDDAVQLALEYETFQNGRKQRIYRKHFGVRIQQMSKICPPMSWMIFSHQEFVRFPKIIGIPKAENPKSKLIIKNNQNKNTGE